MRYGGDRYLEFEELAARCLALATEHPAWVCCESVGQSRCGRPLLLVMLGDHSGEPANKPAFWLDGGTHAPEWTGVMAALYAIERWVADLVSGEPDTTEWFRSHTIYVMPCVSPDGYQAMREGAPFLRSVLRPSRDNRPRKGLSPEDLDGDGRVLWMRWRHPSGSWVFCDPNHPAKMRRRTIDDPASEAFFVCTEGMFLAYDGVRWLEASREFAHDLNRNFPASWAPFEMFGMDAGDFPLSEPESRGVVEAFRARPRIAAAVTNHTYTGCLLTQPYRKPSPLGELDLDLMEHLAEQAVVGTGYRVFRVHPDFTYDPDKAIVGVWADTISTTFGVPGYTLELWDPFGYAGVEVENPALFFKKPEEAVVHATLDAFADEPGSVHPWRAFEHPQLGPVEIGGIEYMMTVRNPPPRLLRAECERGFTVADRVRRHLPEVSVGLSVDRLGDGVSRVALTVENLGWLSTSGLRHAEEIGTAPPLHVELLCGAGVELVEGDRQQALGWLDGWGAAQLSSARHPLYPGLPLARGPRVRAAWLVRGSGALSVCWDAGRGGCGQLVSSAVP